MPIITIPITENVLRLSVVNLVNIMDIMYEFSQIKENLVLKRNVCVITIDWSCDIFDVHKKGQVSSEMPLNKICI